MGSEMISKTFIESGWYISYMNYYATGEGVTSYLMVAGQAEVAERLLKERIAKYFHPGIITAALDASANGDTLKMIEWIPEPTKDLLRTIPLSTGHYFTEVHYNFA